MAKFDRCVICDYTIGEGSEFSGAAPGENGRVLLRPRKGEMYCEKCQEAILDTLGMNMDFLEFDIDDET